MDHFAPLSEHSYPQRREAAELGRRIACAPSSFGVRQPQPRVIRRDPVQGWVRRTIISQYKTD